MDYILILNLGILVGCVASAAVSAWFARKNNVRELENDVTEIASVVEKVYRESKRQQMQRVRAAASETPPGIQANLGLAENPPQLSKAALRRMVFGGKPQ